MKRIGLPGLILLLFVLLLVVPSAVGYYTDWLWFRELGYEGVFLRTLNAQSLVFAATFVVVFLVALLQLAPRAADVQPAADRLGTGVDGRPIALEGRPLARHRAAGDRRRSRRSLGLLGVATTG